MKNKIFAAVMVIVVSVLAACGDDANPEQKKIIFIGSIGSRRDIYIMNEDGSGLANLTNTTSIGEYCPQWSPDGKTIYFLRYESSKYYLYRMNADGTNASIITNQEVKNDNDASWPFDVSPDGKKIAFIGSDGDNEIFVINTDGTNLTKLTNDTKMEYCPSWSPDGELIAFIGTIESDYRELYVMDQEGKNITRLTGDANTENQLSFNYRLSWSPDGKNIAYVMLGKFLGSSGQHYEVFSINYSGAITDISKSVGHDLAPCWSPDGSSIYFVSDRDGVYYKIYKSEDFTLRKLTDNNRDHFYPALSGDGTKVVFQSLINSKYQIFTMNADGTNQTQLTTDDTMSCSLPQWQPGNGRNDAVNE